jgi:hypothetical protein
MGRITRTGTAAAVAAALAAGLAATPVTAADEESFVVVKAGRVITVSGEEISRGEIVIIDGKIRLVGVGLDYPSDATVIDARDQTVMPGWVHPSSRHGLIGYGRNGVAGDASVDDEVMLESIDFDPFLMAGYTAVGLRPDGGGIPGTMSVYRTGAPDDLDPLLGESRTLRRLSALRIGMTSPARDKNILRGAIGKAKAELEKIAKAREEFEKKQAEEKKKAEEAAKNGGEKAADAKGDGEKKEEATFTPPSTDATHQPLMDWLEETLAVRPLIELGDASTLLHLEDVMARHEKLRSNLYLPASGDTVNIVDRLAERDAIVITTMSMTTLPQTSTVFNLAGALDAAGASLALTPESIGGGFGRFRGRGGRGGGGANVADASSSMESARSRLGSLVRAGLSRETAIKAVTLHPAMVLGVDKKIGSIETGKDADLIFLSGDPVDPVTTVERVMILGRIVWEAGQ